MQSVLQNLPVGWKFQPTDGQLLDPYLKNKRLGIPVHGSDIQDVKISDFDPWDLIDKNSASKERYLYCRREFHLKTGGTQRKRKGKGGFWKRTGQIVNIMSEEDEDEVTGTKTIFVYHDPNPTEFVMHEFELDHSPFKGDNDFVVCKLMIIKKKKVIKKRKKVGSLYEKKVAINPEEIDLDCSNKNKPNKKARKDVSYCDTDWIPASNNQQQEEEEIMACSAYDLPLDSENQTPSMMTATSTCEKGGSSHQGACDFEYQINSEMNNTSVYDKDIFLMNSDLDNQNSMDISNLSRYSMSETSSRTAADLENRIPNDVNAISLHEISSSWFGNQNPDEITAVSAHKNVETSKETNISASIEGRWSLLQETPLDFGKQNQYEKTDTSDFWRSLSDTINLDDLADATFPEINSEMLDELFDDLRDTLFSEPPEPLN